MSRFHSGDMDFIGKSLVASNKLKPKAQGFKKKVLEGKELADRIFTKEEKMLLKKLEQGHTPTKSDMVLIESISEKQKKHLQ
jgi:hypothetical protein